VPIPEPNILGVIRRGLPALGLEVHVRRHDWWECLLAGAEESWIGRGASADAAFWSAVRAAFPTAPARAVLLQWAAVRDASRGEPVGGESAAAFDAGAFVAERAAPAAAAEVTPPAVAAGGGEGARALASEKRGAANVAAQDGGCDASAVMPTGAVEARAPTEVATADPAPSVAAGGSVAGAGPRTAAARAAALDGAPSGGARAGTADAAATRGTAADDADPRTRAGAGERAPSVSAGSAGVASDAAVARGTAADDAPSAAAGSAGVASGTAAVRGGGADDATSVAAGSAAGVAAVGAAADNAPSIASRRGAGVAAVGAAADEAPSVPATSAAAVASEEAAQNDDEAIPALDRGPVPRARPDEDPESALRQLIERIECDSRWLACAAPARQRLVLLGWLAVARTWQDDHPEPRVASLVPDVVRRLRALTETWWPGSITAFHRHAWPSDCVRDLPGVDPHDLQTWDDVARHAAATLARIEERDLLAGLDADGWADAAQLRPAPDAPADSLAALVREIERHGPLTQRQPRDRAVPPTEQLVSWARWARWLRGATEDDATWGAVMGRLRYWCQGPDAAPLRQILNPVWRPHAPWIQIIGRAESEVALRDLLARVPSPDAGEAQRLAWLRRALALTTWHHDAIAEAAAPLGPWILGLVPERLGDIDRRIRRRLRKLQESLGSEGERPAPGPDEAALPEEHEPDRAPIARAVLEATRGRHALFVSNRSDPALQERLLRDFSFGALDWAEATPRRIDAAVEKIAAGTFELVLGATGFLGHREDGRLARACKSAGIPYVRVHKGRPSAVAQALMRELPGAVA